MKTKISSPAGTGSLLLEWTTLFLGSLELLELVVTRVFNFWHTMVRLWATRP
jgi:hypothetical protein